MYEFKDGRLYLWSLLVAIVLAGYISYIKTEDNPKQHRKIHDCNENMCPVKKEYQNDAKKDTNYNGWRFGSTRSDG